MDFREVLWGGNTIKNRDSVTEYEETEETLAESENMFRDLAEKSLVGIYLIQDGAFKHVNPRLAEIFGYTVEEMMNNKKPQDLVLPEDWPIVEENLLKRTSGEIESLHFNWRGITKDERIISVEVYGSRTTYQGRPAIIGTLLDITERKHAEEELKRKVEELERFKKLAVGRELKMVELKKRIKELERGGGS